VLLAGPSRTMRGPVRAQVWIEIGGMGTGALTGAPIEHEKARVYARLPDGARGAPATARLASAFGGDRLQVRTIDLEPVAAEG